MSKPSPNAKTGLWFRHVNRPKSKTTKSQCKGNHILPAACLPTAKHCC